MKPRITVITAILVLVATYAGATGQGTDNDLAAYLEPDALLELIEDPPEGFFLVDVRTPPEYESGHIPSAVNAELAYLPELLPTEQRDALLVVYCRSGNRSAQAVHLLRQLGYTRVLDWGGIGNWPYETVNGPDPQ